MFKELLSMTWDEMMESDFVFKSNTEKHVIDIKGADVEDGNESLTVIFYHLLKPDVIYAILKSNPVPPLPDITSVSLVVHL